MGQGNIHENLRPITSDNHLTNRAWFREMLKDQEVILCYTSALECLELFSGYIGEYKIDVYAKQKGEYSNINYRLNKKFDEIETVIIGELVCTSFNQTLNDMLEDFKNVDEQSLIEALSSYYFSSNKSFDGLKVDEKNRETFDLIKDWAIEYYTES